jgi:hypothetical protein
LALRIAAGRLDARPAWTLRDLADRLADRRSRLSQLQLGDLAVRASFQVSYQTLLPDLARSFRLLGLPEGPSIGVPAAAALLNQETAAAESLLEQLVDLNLLETPSWAATGSTTYCACSPTTRPSGTSRNPSAPWRCSGWSRSILRQASEPTNTSGLEGRSTASWQPAHSSSASKI